MVSNESILAALVASGGSVRRAAQAAGCSETAIYDRLRQPSFYQRYAEAKESTLNGACEALCARLCEAVDVLGGIMQDTDNAASVRLQAADAVLRHSIKFVEAADIIKRLEELEKQYQNN